MAEDWSKQFKSLLASPLGVELLRTLKEDVHDNIIREAESAKKQDLAFGLLMQARGVIKVVEHLNTVAALAPKDEGSKSDSPKK